MSYLKLLSILLFCGIILSISSCNNSGKKATDKQADKVVLSELTEAFKLIKYLEETGDYVNSRQFPSLIKAASVWEEIDGNIHIIDIRRPEVYKKGHIKNAINVQFSEIPDYFENKIVPFKYDKIIIVCYGGQYSSYTTSLLRLMAYGNVYSMRWGMSAWNKEFSKDYWDIVPSNKYANNLEKVNNLKAPAGQLPELKTNFSIGEEILNERIHVLFNTNLKDVLISADQVFENPKDYYIMNYDRKDKYEAGHIPGAVRYKPNGTLGILPEMQTIPSDKNIVVYCGTGHNSGFVTAYLRLLGYNTKTLESGTNGFMFDKMLNEKAELSWLPFTEKEIMNYSYVKE
jgi:rhodanese-related sulfurtransferase